MGLNFGIIDYRNGYSIIYLVVIGLFLSVHAVSGTEFEADTDDFESSFHPPYHARQKREDNGGTTTAPKKLNPVIIIAPCILAGVPLLLILLCVIRAFCCKRESERSNEDLVTHVEDFSKSKSEEK